MSFMYIILMISALLVAVAWSVESLPSNSVTRVRFLVGTVILISIMGLGVLSYAVSGGGPDIVLTTHSGRPTNVILCSVLVHSMFLPYRHVTHGHWVVSRGGVQVLHCRWVNNKWRKKKEKDNCSYLYSNASADVLCYSNAIARLFSISFVLLLLWIWNARYNHFNFRGMTGIKLY